MIESKIVKRIHDLILENTKFEVAIDATVGNGYDTLFLAQHFKKVIGIDIQPLAIKRTTKKIEGLTNVELYLDDFNNIELLLKSKILDEQQTHLILKIFTHIGGSDSQGIPTKEEANNAEILIAKIPRRISNRKFLDYIQQRITNYKSSYYK